MVPAFAAQAGLQQFVAPFGVAERGAFARDGGIEQRRCGVAEIGHCALSLADAGWHRQFDIFERADGRRGNGFDCERPGDAGARFVDVGLVVERFLVGVAGDGGVDLLAGHAFADFGIVGDGFEGDVRDGLVAEAAADAFFGVREFVVVEIRRP